MESKVGKVEDKPEHFKTDPERNWTEDLSVETISLEEFGIILSPYVSRRTIELRK